MHPHPPNFPKKITIMADVKLRNNSKHPFKNIPYFTYYM
jgi:hypothetical protein